MITPREFAEATDIPYPTVARWLQRGLVPGAEREETLRGPAWLIPRKAVETFETWRPKIGRPLKPAGEKPAKKKDK